MNLSNAGVEGALGQVDRFVLPKRDDRALRFLVSHLFIPHNRREWLWSRVARGALGLSRWGLSSPLGLSPDRATDLIGEVLSWARAEIPGGKEDEWSFILHRDRPLTEWTRLLLFLFHGQSRQPFAVVKIARGGLRAEWNALRFLSRTLPPELATAVPSPVLYRSFDGADAVLMRSVPGSSMDHQIGRRPLTAKRVARHLSDGATWLACFHLVTRRSGASFRADEEAARLIDELPDELEPLCSTRLDIPLSASHGDFWARNLLVRRRPWRRGRAMTDISGVVDWEHFTPAAPPFEDLFHFTLSYALDYPWAAFSREAPEDAFQRGFLSDTGVSRAIRAALVGYCDLTGLAFPALRPLFHLFLLRRTLRDRRSKPEHWSSLHLPLARSRSTVFEI